MRPENYKTVDLAFDYHLINDMEPGGAYVVVNWSTEFYPNGTGAPPMPWENEFVGRAEVTQLWIDPSTPNGSYSGSFDL